MSPSLAIIRLFIWPTIFNWLIYYSTNLRLDPLVANKLVFSCYSRWLCFSLYKLFPSWWNYQWKYTWCLTQYSKANRFLRSISLPLPLTLTIVLSLLEFQLTYSLQSTSNSFISVIRFYWNNISKSNLWKCQHICHRSKFMEWTFRNNHYHSFHCMKF